MNINFIEWYFFRKFVGEEFRCQAFRNAPTYASLMVTWDGVALYALVRQFLLEDLQPALSRGFGAIARTLSVLSVVSSK